MTFSSLFLLTSSEKRTLRAQTAVWQMGHLVLFLLLLLLTRAWGSFIFTSNLSLTNTQGFSSSYATTAPRHPDSSKGHSHLLILFLDGFRGVELALIRSVLLLAAPEAGSLESSLSRSLRTPAVALLSALAWWICPSPCSFHQVPSPMLCPTFRRARLTDTRDEDGPNCNRGTGSTSSPPPRLPPGSRSRTGRRTSQRPSGWGLPSSPPCYTRRTGSWPSQLVPDRLIHDCLGMIEKSVPTFTESLKLSPNCLVKALAFPGFLDFREDLAGLSKAKANDQCSWSLPSPGKKKSSRIWCRPASSS